MRRRLVHGERFDAVRIVLVVASTLSLAYVVLGVVAPAQSHDVVPDTRASVASLGWALRLVLTTVTALTLVMGPGLVLRSRNAWQAVLGNAAFLWIPGVSALVATGLLAWSLGSWVSPWAVSTAMLTAVSVWILWSASRPSMGEVIGSSEQVVLVMVVLLLVVGVGRASWSMGPDDELYGGTISRTLEVGPRSDSRISYNVVQLVAHGDAPYSTVGAAYYEPYNFSARGPIAGLAAAPLVLGGQTTPPRAMPPNQSWEPFDAQGFATYRILVMLLNATVVLGAYGVLTLVIDRRRAVAGAALVALCPFVVHEVYFTWPKLLAASFALSAAVALLRRYPLLAGILIGAGYLAHPSALFVVPALALGWWVIRRNGVPVVGCEGPSRSRWLRAWSIDVVKLVVGLAAVYVGWSLVNVGHSTDYFTEYLTSAGGRTSVSFGQWFDSRVHSLANTLVPLRLYLADPTDIFINAVGGKPAADISRFSFLSRATLPFAVGIAYFPMFVYGTIRFARGAATLFLSIIVVPFMCFIVYWGANTTGIVREGMHAIFVAAVLVAFLGHSVMRHEALSASLVRISATIRVLEVVFMICADTVLTAGWFGRDLFAATDVLSLFAIVASLAALAVISWWSFGPDRIGIGIGRESPDGAPSARDVAGVSAGSSSVG